MKILRVYINLPPIGGGMENHILKLSQLQRNLGHSVNILFSKGVRSNDQDICILKNFSFANIKPQIIRYFIFYIFAMFHLIRKEKRYEVVHIHGDSSSFLFGPLYKFFTKADKLIFTIHGTVIDRSRIGLCVLRFLVSKADVVFSTGYETLKKLDIGRKGFFQPSGIEDCFFCKTKEFSDDFSVVSVSNLVPNKNIITILKVAKELPNIRFNIIGGGKEESILKNYILDNDIRNVEFFGRKSKIEIAALMTNASILLHTSLFEGTPTVVLEAIASGLPIVSSNAGGLSHIIKNRKNGFIVYDPCCVKQYVKYIKYLENNEMLFRDISKNNIELSKNYRWKNIALHITKIMHNE